MGGSGGAGGAGGAVTVQAVIRPTTSIHPAITHRPFRTEHRRWWRQWRLRRQCIEADGFFGCGSLAVLAEAAALDWLLPLQRLRPFLPAVANQTAFRHRALAGAAAMAAAVAAGLSEVSVTVGLGGKGGGGGAAASVTVGNTGAITTTGRDSNAIIAQASAAAA
jgi:hypothetical protein